ncbi:hypothetical protein JTB14_011347 [Gonioctena quinquepunctata]|nr:hypothetical protein JTB14_011347 [Gonioctena quinquepunctata]
MFDNPLEIKKKRAEIKLAGLSATNNLPFSLMDVLTPLCKDIFPDSKIAQESALQRTEATHVVRENISKIIPKALQNRGKMLDALSKERRECWVRALKRGNLSDTFLKHARICADHFVSGEPAKLEDRERPDWVPSVNMGYISMKTQYEQSIKRHDRLVERQTKRLKMDEVDEAGNTALIIEPTAGQSTEALKTSELQRTRKSKDSLG